MYKYKFIKIHKESNVENPFNNYHKLIDDFAKDGWRFVQIFSISDLNYIELIFEKNTINK